MKSKPLKIIFLHLLLLSLFFFHIPVEAKAKTSKKYKYQIAACLMFYNESYFLKEWIEYHKLIGIEHFYLFNNGSTDNYLEILTPYINSGEVELYNYPVRGCNQQEHNRIQCQVIYNHALQLARGYVKWLAIIDADEFIYPVKENSLNKVLKKYEKFGGVYADYLFFGTAHVEKVPENCLILETLNRSAEKPIAFGKSIVRPEKVSDCSDPHRMWYHSPYFHVDTNGKTFDWTPEKPTDDTLLIYHYYIGDIDHALNVAFPRRKVWVGITIDTYLDSVEWMNDRPNTSMKRFTKQLREKMNLP